MKRLFFLMSILLTSFNSYSQTFLHDKNGIRYSYTTSVETSAYCKAEKKTVYFIKLSYTVSNNSEQTVRISSSIQMCNDAFANCLSEDEVFRYESNRGQLGHQDIRNGVLRSGDSYFGAVGNWYYKETAAPCAWNIVPEFPTKGTTLKVNVDLTPTNTNKSTTQPTIGISQQGDVIHNPKPKVDYAQKQMEENKTTDNNIKAWQNSNKDNQDQINKINSIPNKYQLQQTSQQQELQRQQQINAQQKLNEIQQKFAEQQQRYRQTQIELDNAKNVSMNAYQEAINSGRKESGALLESALSGGAQISDPTGSLIYTGVGLGVSLFVHLAEKKAERKEKELETQKVRAEIRLHEEEKLLIINTKAGYIKEALKINQYNFTDLILKPRYATLILIPKNFDTYSQTIYFTYPVEIPKYIDSTYPLKDVVQNKLLKALDQNIVKYKSVYILYPITDVKFFLDEFVKKMGSGKVIKLEAEIVNYLKLPFATNTLEITDTDFWGNPIKKENKKIETKPTKKDDSFWNN